MAAQKANVDLRQGFVSESGWTLADGCVQPIFWVMVHHSDAPMSSSSRPLPLPVRLLGLSGVLPQVLCLAAVLAEAGSPGATVPAALGLAYAALILSFLGGLWWMAALQQGVTRAGPYGVAVLPSLLGWVALFPLALGLDVVPSALGFVGVLLLLSPLIDFYLARSIPLPAGWVRLRMMMAGGLGLLTLALALV